MVRLLDENGQQAVFKEKVSMGSDREEYAMMSNKKSTSRCSLVQCMLNWIYKRDVQSQEGDWMVKRRR